MIEIIETPTGLKITKHAPAGQPALVIELASAAVPTALGPLIAELCAGVPWNAPTVPEVPRADDADFVRAWDLAARVCGNVAA